MEQQDSNNKEASIDKQKGKPELGSDKAGWFTRFVERCLQYREPYAKWLDSTFEPFIWLSRHVAIISVLVSFLVSIIWFIASIKKLCTLILKAFKNGLATEALISDSVLVIDAALMAAIFMIIAFGIYDLFISKIDPIDSDGQRAKGKILRIKDIDELKSKLTKVILLVLIVKIFSAALIMEFTSSISLVHLGLVILLIAAAIFLSHSSIHIHISKSNEDKDEDDDTYETTSNKPSSADSN